jgi:hypothetical protein
VEILSPGTDRDDVFIKLPAYQRISSLQPRFRSTAPARDGRARYSADGAVPRDSGAFALSAQSFAISRAMTRRWMSLVPS